MILLDTNVVSEPSALRPNPNVLAWFAAQTPQNLYLSTVTVAELRAGIALLPAGKRCDAMNEHLETRLLPSFAGRILPFDLACTKAYADLRARAKAVNSTLAAADSFIAAIALAHGFAVATRDTAPFIAAGARIVDPWQ